MSLYRILTVSKLTGVPTATLRAWERRYGVPQPARSASAYRLYGERDLSLVLRMRDLVEGGTAPSEAARIVRAETRADVRGDAAPATEEGGDSFARSADRIVEATTRFDPDALEAEVSRAMTLGPALSIFDRTVAPALHRIGELWHAGRLTVAQEHFASNLLGATTGQLLRLAQPGPGARRAALAAFADEEHTIGLLGAALHFASWGFRTLLLGARTPPSAVARVVESLAPEVVALSATLSPEPPRARELVDAYADACRRSVWVVGGQAAGALSPWVEKRGGLAVLGPLDAARPRIERALLDVRAPRTR